MGPRKTDAAHLSFFILLKLSLDCLFLFFSPEELFNWLFRVVDATDESAEDSDVKDGDKLEFFPVPVNVFRNFNCELNVLVEIVEGFGNPVSISNLVSHKSIINPAVVKF